MVDRQARKEKLVRHILKVLGVSDPDPDGSRERELNELRMEELEARLARDEACMETTQEIRSRSGIGRAQTRGAPQEPNHRK